MTPYSKQLSERMVTLDERRAWDRFSPAEQWGFGIPGEERPLVASFDRGPERRFLQFNETRPTEEPGLEMCLMFVPPRQAPAYWRGLLRQSPDRSRVDGSLLVFPVAPVEGRMRPARVREVLWALYVVAAFDKAWCAGDIDPGTADCSERVPFLDLEGPPEDPRYEVSSILVKRHGEPGAWLGNDGE